LSDHLIPANVRDSIGVDAMFGIDEEKLNTLDDCVLADLHRNGYLPRIYAHLKSLQNLSKLIRRLEAQKFLASAKQAGFDA